MDITLPTPVFLNTILAAAPILVVLYLMIQRHWGGSQAGLAGWLTAVLISLIIFGANLPLLLVASGKAVLLALFVLLIIWFALLLYNTVNEAGVITAIGQQMPQLAHDQPAQALLIAWIFASFLQGATGFGVPAAVVAPLLVGMGFTPNVAVVIALLGHAWAVTYGSLGSSFLSLMAATGLPGEVLASPVAIMLGLCCLCCGLGVLWLVGGGTAVRQRGLFMVIMALIMGSAQWVVAQFGFYTLASIGGGLAGLIAAIAYFTTLGRVPGAKFDLRPLLLAFFPYAIVTIIIILGQTVLKDALGKVIINPTFPAVATRYGWQTAAGTGRSINVFGHGGSLLLYGSLIVFAWYKWRGPLGTATAPSYSGQTIWRKTLKGWSKPTIGMFSLVAMALTMEHAGMTQLLAEALSQTGRLFPLLSPFIGGLGAFVTGSNTNSNVVFGQLQQQTAVALSLSVPLILAAQTSGGAIGALFAPAKVLVGVSTVAGAEDGDVLKAATTYGVAILLIVGAITWLTTLL